MGTKPRRQYTPVEKREALEIFAINRGRPDYTQKVFEEKGLDVHMDTVRRWTREQPDLYDGIRRSVEGRIRAEHEEGFRENVTLAQAVAHEALRQAQQHLERGEADVKELAKISQTASIVAAISIDKSELLAGRPTEIHDHVGDAADLLRDLGRIGVTVVVPGADGRLRPLAEDGSAPVIDVPDKGSPELVGAESGKDEGKADAG